MSEVLFCATAARSRALNNTFPAHSIECSQLGFQVSDPTSTAVGPGKRTSILGLALHSSSLARLAFDVFSLPRRMLLQWLCPAVLQLVTCCPAIPALNLGSSASSLVLMALHHPFLFLFLCQWDSSPFPYRCDLALDRHCPLEPFRLRQAFMPRILLLPHRTTSSLSFWYVSSRDR